MYKLFPELLACVFLLLSACEPTVRHASGEPNLQLPADTTVYQAAWKDESPNQLNQASQSVNHEGQAIFTFVVGKDGSVVGITKEQVLPMNAEVTGLRSLLEKSRFVPVYKRGAPVESYQSYTFYYGNMAYLEYWRETCEHEGNRNKPPSDSGIDAVHPHFCTRIQYPDFVAYRFLLWPTRAACSGDIHQECKTGSVRLSFKINGDGHPMGVTIITSHAGGLIDLAAEAAVDNWYFVPATGTKLHTDATYTVTIIYQG